MSLNDEVTWCLEDLVGDIPGVSWNIPHGIRIPTYTNLQGCPRTVLRCPSWDITSPQLTGMSQDSPVMLLMGSSRYLSYVSLQDVLSWDMHLCGILRTPATGMFQDCHRDVPGPSWDMHLCGTLQTPAAGMFPGGLIS